MIVDPFAVDHVSGKGGLMIRESLDANSTNFFIYLNKQGMLISSWHLNLTTGGGTSDNTDLWGVGVNES